MPFVTIKTTRTNLTRSAKEQVVREMTDTMQRVLGKKPENIHIVFDVVEDEDWGLGGELVVNRRKATGT